MGERLYPSVSTDYVVQSYKHKNNDNFYSNSIRHLLIMFSSIYSSQVSYKSEVCQNDTERLYKP